MKKSIIAILLVFSLLAGFAACKKVGDDQTVENVPGFEDENGNFYTVDAQTNANGETEYFIESDGTTKVVVTEVDSDGNTKYYVTDENGNKKPVSMTEKTTVVDKTVSTTLTPDQEKINDMMENLEKNPDAYLETNVETVTMPISDDLIPTENITEVEVEIGNNGKPANSQIIDNYINLMKSGKYSVKATVTMNSAGTTATMPLEISIDGNRFHLETLAPVEGSGGKSIRLSMMSTGEKVYMIIPSMKSYMEADAEQFKDMIPQDTTDNSQMDYVRTYTVKVDGKNYTVEEYISEDKVTTVKYYIYNNALKRIEVINGADSILYDFAELSGTVNSSKFKLPAGYMDLSAVLTNGGYDLGF